MIQYKRFISTRCFGVELETSQTLEREVIKELIAGVSPRAATITEFSASKNNRNWHIKMDASCGGVGEEFGWEVASYKGSGIEDIISMAATAQRLRDAGLRVNNRCGLHVHAEVNDFCPHRMGFLLARWLAIEPWLFNAVPFRRGASAYCRPLRFVRPINETLKHTPWDLWDYFKPTYKTHQSQDYRRVALNLCNFYLEMDKRRKQRCTVELRLPEGSLRGVDVKNWIRFFVHLVETSTHDVHLSSLTAPTLNDFFDACGIGHEDGFTILSPGLRETKLWLLKRLRKYQFNRNSQEIDDYIHRMTWPEKLAL
jgi:hypothetical protein